MSVRTVLGDVPTGSLGRTDYHEHLFQVSPLLPGDELADERLARDEAALLLEAGITAIIEATPLGLGRDPEGMARVSAATGLAVVATTGCHRPAHYRPDHPLLRAGVQDLTARFVADVRDGMPALATDSTGPIPTDLATLATLATHGGRPVRAGLLKLGIDYWSISAFSLQVSEAVGAAHRQTGAPVMVHLEYGSAALEILELLAEHGVPASAVVLAHVDRNPDPGLHAELASTGAYLGYDGPARHREHPDSVIIDCMQRTIEAAGSDRILLGGDVARATRYVAAGGMPGLAYLPRRFIPRLEQAIGAAAVQAILEANPHAFLDRF